MKTLDLNNLPILLNAKDAMAISGLARSTLYDLLQTGDIERKMIGRHVLVVTQSLLDFIEQLPDYRFNK
jgi:predicted DNA-binding transcriptional regulator AlpA